MTAFNFFNLMSCFILFHVAVTKMFFTWCWFPMPLYFLYVPVSVSVFLCNCCAPDAPLPLVNDLGCNDLLAFASALEAAEKSHVFEFCMLQSANFILEVWLLEDCVQDKCMKKHFCSGTGCVIIFYKHQIAEFKVKAVDPLRREPVCLSLTFAFFLFSLLAHVVFLPLSALRLWWVKEKRISATVFYHLYDRLLSNSLMVLIVAKHFDLLCMKLYLYRKLVCACTHMHERTLIHKSAIVPLYFKHSD